MTVNVMVKDAAHPDAIRSAYLRAVITEGLIAACINTLMGGAVDWIRLHGHESSAFWGASGIIVDIIPSTFFPTLLMVFLLGAVIRKRREAGALGAASQGRAPAWMWFFPTRLWGFALALGLTVTMISLALAALAVALTGPSLVPVRTIWIAKAVLNALIGLACGALIAARTIAQAPTSPALDARGQAEHG